MGRVSYFWSSHMEISELGRAFSNLKIWECLVLALVARTSFKFEINSDICKTRNPGAQMGRVSYVWSSHMEISKLGRAFSNLKMWECLVLALVASTSFKFEINYDITKTRNPGAQMGRVSCLLMSWFRYKQTTENFQLKQ